MSAYLDIREDFRRELAQAGWMNSTEVPDIWRSRIPDHILRRWLRKDAEVIEIDPSRPGRLINHFQLGADPEFTFFSPTSGERMPAQYLNFRAGLAWGADNNGRLAEIRPQPSRHALGVAASIWSTLHWMTRFAPDTLQLCWRSGAWFEGDGMGGHVHFGRKRPTWPREIQALDTLAFWLQHTNILNASEWHERIRRTRGRGNYGQLSDRRVQVHGWEYRTIPSWLDSPWLAYTVLVLSKLAVFDPELFPILDPSADSQSVGSVRAKLRGVLGYFKSRDDDAALAHKIFLKRGWPQFSPQDFKSQWGIFGGTLLGAPPVPWTLPSMIPSTPQACGELAKAMFENRAPEWPGTPPTWSPSQLPPGYTQPLRRVETFHAPGLGELLRELVIHEKHLIAFASSGSSDIDLPIPAIPKTPWLDKMRETYPDITFQTHSVRSDQAQRWFLPGAYAANPTQRKQVLDFLTSGWAPIWRLQQVRADSLEKYLAARKPQSAPRLKKFACVQLYPQASKRPEKAPAERIEMAVPPPQTVGNSFFPSTVVDDLRSASLRAATQPFTQTFTQTSTWTTIPETWRASPLPPVTPARGRWVARLNEIGFTDDEPNSSPGGVTSVESDSSND